MTDRELPSVAASPLWDDRLLEGFDFSCRTDCALCCYAAPRIDAADRHAWGAAARSVPHEIDAEGTRRIPEQAPGGACRMLTGTRCSIHRWRPGVCASFPVDVYAGIGRWQASVVLSCPGLSLGGLGRSARGAGAVPPTLGGALAAERIAARARTKEPVAVDAFRRVTQRRASLERRGQRRSGWADAPTIRASLRETSELPWAGQWPGEPPPSADQGSEYLPLFFDHRAGPVAIADDGDAWELLELRPNGRTEALGRFRLPESPPRLTAEGAHALRSYLAYWLDRDGLWDLAVAGWIADEERRPLEERMLEELGVVGATVVARGYVRALARGDPGVSLDRSAVENGIRASDADLLDRATLGAVL